MATKTLAKFERHDAKFLSPKEVGSSIRWVVSASLTQSERGGRKSSFAAFVTLTDCDKSISWDAYGNKGPAHMRKKLRVAIRMFEQMLAAVNEAEVEYKSRSTQDEEF